MYKLIVGLGNPGLNFNFTPHNVGFMLIDYLLKEFRKYVVIEENSDKFNLIYRCRINNQWTLLLKPQTYMNLSGLALKKVINKYDVRLSKIFIIHDEINLDVGKFKIKQNGNDGGHNGIKNIIDVLKTRDFLKLKIGVGRDRNIPLSQYVLKKMNQKDIDLIHLNFVLFKRLIDIFLTTNSLESLFMTISNFKKNN
ncbi:MAG: aminoacyl-tRNA hydrolase [Sweet potato little leaf phytoplasma]|uniref:Peptidyl-tRNA hydrolase n=2 Tax=Candidatus Phytoplasma TaxID=33926 RepID=A0ABN0J7L4_PEWBP|nr:MULTISPECIES: aminoacyl-tRNA hydrolase [Phytoplasma]QLL37037.1 peptidyl-tRNA hydrolase ['Echinacea purpurea' witches'-broom phytoplasma]WEX20580.1 MAG: peptidyl-tRNA hydrolase [Candidatus Phytoplasma aurantifolia]WKV64289.1 MAG: peptidyl-tRNA hydrolase [Candidatus Phytoplasma australasiaticum]EMR14438.1 peptidyl-tRNA hydrolase [Peanut witches'-broom phytoplasma NTU2011]MDO7987117.1 aminoacyl-tRNA hydrolase [Sweet potato little leaf phytoplasma]